MIGKEGEINVDSSTSMVPYEGFSLESVLFSLQEVPMSRGEVLRQQFESEYAEHILHQRHILLPCPSREEDPEGYMRWMESSKHLTALAQQDLHTASIVKRFATPLHERINQNKPPEKKVNKLGIEVDEYGRELWLRQEEEEDEFEDLIRSAERAAGIEVPINRFQTFDILTSLTEDICREGEELVMLDAILSAREGGEVYRWDGTLVTIEVDPEQKKKYEEAEARLERKIQNIQDVQMRYLELLPPAEQSEWRRKNKIPELNG